MAVAWYRMAADQGFAAAQYNLAFMYEDGRGVQQDEREAARWYRRAAGQSYVDAQNNLGVMYFQGRGVSRDLQQALLWLLLASEGGNLKAAVNSALVERELTVDQQAHARTAARNWKPDQ